MISAQKSKQTSDVLTERGLTTMRNRNTLLRAEADCALIVSCVCEAFEIEYNIRGG